MKHTSKSLSAAIKRDRAQKAMTQTAYAKKMGVSQQKLSDWENGKRLRAVAEALKLVSALKLKV